MEMQRTDCMMKVCDMISSSIGQAELPELSTGGTTSFSERSQSGMFTFEIVDLRNVKVYAVDSVLFYTVMEGSPEVHYHLHSPEWVQRTSFSTSFLSADSSPSQMRPDDCVIVHKTSGVPQKDLLRCT